MLVAQTVFVPVKVDAQSENESMFQNNNLEVSLDGVNKEITLTYTGEGNINLDNLDHAYIVFDIPQEFKLSEPNPIVNLGYMLRIISGGISMSSGTVETHLQSNDNQIYVDYLEYIDETGSGTANFEATTTIGLDELPSIEGNPYTFSASVMEKPYLDAGIGATDNLTVSDLKEEQESVEIPFETLKKDDDSIDKGKEVLDQEGINGEKTITYIVEYKNGEELNRTISNEEVTIKPQDEIILVGTKETEVKEEVEKETIPYEQIENEDETLEEGKKKTQQKGINGEKEIVYEVTYVNGEEVDRVKTGEKITKEVRDEIILVGTKEIEKPIDGEDVRDLKLNLTKLGFGNFPEDPSKTYGEVTAKVVRDFQKAFGLEVTGEADKTTLNKIDELLNNEYSNGQKGNHVRELKQDLTKLGFGNFPKNPSKIYGNVTANVVKEFQDFAKLPKTGVADENTLNAIEKVLNPPYANGDRGLAISDLKVNLTTLGFGNFPKNPSINYGKVTANVVKDFQQAFDLAVTGSADKTTLNKINELLNNEYSIGQDGNHVRELKQDLTKLGFGNFPKKPSKTYGKITSNIVKEFQGYAKLPETGIADEKTLNAIEKALNPPYENGDRGVAISDLKVNLTILGFGNFPKNPSINYGKVTTNVVKDFQQAFNLDVSGNVDKATLNKIDYLLNNKYSIGQKGNHVRELKQDLTKLGFGNFPKNPSNAYGKVTANVVKDFQAYAKLPQTGVADQKTLDKINNVLRIPYKKGDRGVAIAQLKKDLTKAGYGNFPKNPSVTFGKVTENVVKEFQKDHGLKIDGIVGNETLEAVSNSFRIKVQLLVNIEREKRGLTKLKTNDTVMKIAQEHSIYMSNVKYEHGNYGDSLKNNGIEWSTAGENIASGYSTPERVVDAWMKSKGHKENILNPAFSYIGVGYTDDKKMWTQIFYGE